jgi:hypothetical protein
MDATLKTIQQEICQMRKDLTFLRHVAEEDFELSEYAIQQLEAARNTPLSKYIRHEDIEKKYLR